MSGGERASAGGGALRAPAGGGAGREGPVEGGAPDSDLRKPPRRFSDEAIAAFRLLRWVSTRIWPGKAAYRRWLARGGVRTEHVDVPVPGLPEALDGLVMVQLSDLHGGCFLDEGSLGPVTDLVAAAEPDLLFVTGDFVTRTVDDVYELGAFLGRLPAPAGKFAVLGNHDYRGRRERQIEAFLRRQGVQLLRNASALVRRGEGRLRIVGLEDIEESKGADLSAALADAGPDDHVTVLLCHHPDVVDALPPGRFDLVLSGHSHGGQILLPLIGTPGKPWMPRRLSGTHPLDGGGLLHVNRGIGVLVVPFRLRARAEVTRLVLRRA